MVLADRDDRRCRHFTGMKDDVCKAGVRYADVQKDHDPIRYVHRKSERVPYTHTRSFPCLGKYNLGGAVCDKLSLPTPEEVAAEEAEWERLFERTKACRAAIVAHLGGPWKRGMAGSAGAIDCPACGAAGALRFTRSGYNGHVHAACTTADCVSWME